MKKKKAEQALQAGRITHIREVCMNVLHRDGAYTDRAWLAQSVLNILDGNIDAQIEYEQLPKAVRDKTVPAWGEKRARTQ